MKILRITIAVSVLAGLLAGDVWADGVPGWMMETRFGNVVAVSTSGFYSIGPWVIFFRGRTVYQSKHDALVSPRLFPLANRDVLLFEDVEGGSRGFCHLRFLILTLGGKAEVAGGDDFYPSTDSGAPQVVGDTIVFDLGYEKKKRKIATLRGNKVLIDYQPAAKIPYPEERCHEIYEGIAWYASSREDKDCERVPPLFNSILESNYLAADNHPGVDSYFLRDMCVKSCQAGKAAVSYKEFRKRACSL